MKYLLALLVLAFACATTSPATAVRRDRPLDRLMSNTVALESDDGRVFCSGVVSEGVIVTAAHCVEDRLSVRVRRGQDTFRAYVADIEVQQDVAVLDTLDYDLGKGIPFARSAPELGDDIWVVGHSLGIYEFSLTRGIVSHPKRDDGLFAEMIWMQHDAGSINGNSGGPVVNKRGQLVGITSFGVLAAVICRFQCSGVYERSHISGAVHWESIDAILPPR